MHEPSPRFESQQTTGSAPLTPYAEVAMPQVSRAAVRLWLVIYRSPRPFPSRQYNVRVTRDQGEDAAKRRYALGRRR